MTQFVHTIYNIYTGLAFCCIRLKFNPCLRQIRSTLGNRKHKISHFKKLEKIFEDLAQLLSENSGDAQ